MTLIFDCSDTESYLPQNVAPLMKALRFTVQKKCARHAEKSIKKTVAKKGIHLIGDGQPSKTCVQLISVCGVRMLKNSHALIFFSHFLRRKNHSKRLTAHFL